MERNAVAISEKRGRARDFSNVAGDRRPRKRIRDQAQIAGRLCGIICLLAQKLSKRCPKQAHTTLWWIMTSRRREFPWLLLMEQHGVASTVYEELHIAAHALIVG